MLHVYRELYSNQSANLAHLRIRYPGTLDGYESTFGWPDGWHQIVIAACEMVHLHYPQARWHRIHSVRRRLQLHATCTPILVAGGGAQTPDEARHQLLWRESQMLDRLEDFGHQSETTCARCGCTGQLRTLGTLTIALCDHCHRPIHAAHLADVEP